MWQAVLGELQLSVPKPSYDTWLLGTSGVSFAGGRLVVSAPNAFVSEMLESRMYSVVHRAVEKVAEHGVELRFQAGAEGASLDNGASPAQAPMSQRRNGSVNGRTPPRRAAPVNPKYTFDSFIVGKSNELAHAAAAAVSEWPGARYNPLFIYSGVGLGKTHLIHAIAGSLTAKGADPIYATTEDFTNQYVQSIREGKTETFRERYRSADALLLDDIQFIIGKDQTQEGFFHTFNALHLAGRQMVISSDRPAAALTLLEDRVSSRLAGGLVVDIQLPDYETRLAILRAKTERCKVQFPGDVLEFLAERTRSNIRELEGCLNRLVAYAELADTPISLDMVKSAAADILMPGRPSRVSDTAVLGAVSEYFEIDQEIILGRRRDKQTAKARQVAMYLLREEAGMTVTAIGRFLGGKDHSTVLHACQSIASKMEVDTILRQDVFNIRESLNSP